MHFSGKPTMSVSVGGGIVIMILKQRVPISFIVAICCMTAVLSSAGAENVEPAGKATVKAEILAVYSRMSVSSEVVKSFKKGDVVIVDNEIEGSEGAWCGIVEQGQTALSGYVLCKYLEQGPQKKSWQHLGSSIDKGSISETKVRIMGKQVLVPVTLGYKGKTVEVLLLLDTGASSSVINTEIADRLGIDPAETKIGIGQVVGGGLIQHFIAKLNYITFGPHTKDEMEISIVNHKGPPVNHDGLLGMDFLHDLQYTIDFKNQIIKWEQ